MEDNDDLPPHKQKRPDEDSFAGALGLTFTGLIWVAAFGLVGLVVLYALVHGF
jgi:hypothetical protein